MHFDNHTYSIQLTIDTLIKGSQCLLPCELLHFLEQKASNNVFGSEPVSSSAVTMSMSIVQTMVNRAVNFSTQKYLQEPRLN